MILSPKASRLSSKFRFRTIVIGNVDKEVSPSPLSIQGKPYAILRTFGGAQEFMSYDYYQGVIRYAIEKNLLNTDLKR